MAWTDFERGVKDKTADKNSNYETITTYLLRAVFDLSAGAPKRTGIPGERVFL